MESTSSSAYGVKVGADGIPDYSILAIAGAMYLLLSIAAADLWAGCALFVEGRGSGGNWFWRRKAFGVCLVGTFMALIGASIRVLFYSSYEDVEWVLGAAAVLFIADVVSLQCCSAVYIPLRPTVNTRVIRSKSHERYQR